MEFEHAQPHNYLVDFWGTKIYALPYLVDVVLQLGVEIRL